MKVIHRTHDLTAARVMVSYLQANGVVAELLDAATTSILPTVGGVRIAIDPEQEPIATRLLKEKGVVFDKDE
ncbi:MAG: hypothetical protein AAF720_14780 [Pseudomonadota bacterium]